MKRKRERLEITLSAEERTTLERMAKRQRQSMSRVIGFLILPNDTVPRSHKKKVK